MKKKVIFAYSFSDRNAGDFSLNIAAVDILVKNSFHVTIISRFSKNQDEFIRTKKYFINLYGDNVKVVYSPFRLDRTANFLVKLKNYIYGLLISTHILKNKYMERLINESDLVVLCGGNVLRCDSFTDFARLLALDYPLSLARNYNKKYIIFPQSTANINFLGKLILGKMVNNSKTTFIRENISYKKLSSLFPKANVVKTLDLAFFLLDKNKFKPPSNNKKVAFTIRADTLGGLSSISTYDKKLISNEIIKQVKTFIKIGYQINFVIQGEVEDGILTRNIANILFEDDINISVIEERDTFKLIDIYSEFDLLIGMRLHSIILAAVAGTPSYGFFKKEWGLKNPGILEQLGLPYSYINEGINSNDLIDLLKNKKAFQNRIKELYISEKNTIYSSLI